MAFGINFPSYSQSGLLHWSVLEMFVNTNYSFESFAYFTGLLLTFKIISTMHHALCITPPGDIQYNLYNYHDGGNDNDGTYDGTRVMKSSTDVIDD